MPKWFVKLYTSPIFYYFFFTSILPIFTDICDITKR